MAEQVPSPYECLVARVQDPLLKQKLDVYDKLYIDAADDPNDHGEVAQFLGQAVGRLIRELAIGANQDWLGGWEKARSQKPDEEFHNA